MLFHRRTEIILKDKCNFLFYIRFKKKIQDILRQYNTDTWAKQLQQLPCVLYILDLGTKGNKNIYFSTVESGHDVIKHVQEK